MPFELFCHLVLKNSVRNTTNFAILFLYNMRERKLSGVQVNFLKSGLPGIRSDRRNRYTVHLRGVLLQQKRIFFWIEKSRSFLLDFQTFFIKFEGFFGFPCGN